MHEMTRLMWNAQRTRLNFMCEESLTDFWLWSSYQSSLDRPKGMGWRQRCWITFHTKTLCFLQGLCYSVHNEQRRFWNGSPVRLHSDTCWGPCFLQGAQWRQQERFDFVLKGWQGTPTSPWKFGSFLSLIKQGCITLNICLLVRTY